MVELLLMALVLRLVWEQHRLLVLRCRLLLAVVRWIVRCRLVTRAPDIRVMVPVKVRLLTTASTLGSSSLGFGSLGLLTLALLFGSTC